MTGSSSPIRRALERLTQDDSPLRDELVTHVVDHALSLPLREVVDLHRVRALVLYTLTEQNVQRIVDRHVRPGWRRYAEAIVTSEAQVATLVPEPARSRIHAIAGKLRIPGARWADGAVDVAQVRRLLAPVWTQVLLSFAARLPIPGLGNRASSGLREGSAGVTGFLARSVQARAQKVAERSRSMMSGLGIDVDKHLADAARNFSDSAAQIFRQALRDRLATAEGRELLEQMVGGVVEHVLRTRFSALQLDADELPLDDAFAVAPQIVAHAARSSYVEEIVQRELDAYLAQEAGRSLGTMLAEFGALDDARNLLLDHGRSVTTRFMRLPAFSDWLGRLFAD